jgi:YesN/AraC family two-component response regulator
MEGAFAMRFDKERKLLASLRRGDKSSAMKSLDELFDLIQKTWPDDFESIRLFSMELAVLLSRAASGEFNMMEETYYRCLKRLQESTTVAELRGNLDYVVNHIGPQIFSFQGIRHASALRKAERFIWDNYTRKISLKEIAAASGLSAPYLSTIFKQEMGKNLSTFINQLRVEKAAAMLTETALPLNEIAGACGFEDQSWFSKIFKSHTELSPGQYRKEGNSRMAGTIQ